MKNRAVFVDRDGTINVDGPYLSDPAGFEMYPGVGEGIKMLKTEGYKIIVITNQSGIARKYFTEQVLSEIHARMRDEFRKYNVELDGIYYCPHHPDDNCNCRKPKTGLFETAINEHNIDTKLSFMVGDKIQDIEAGEKIGAGTVLILHPNIRNEYLSKKYEWKCHPDYIAENFMGAVDHILKTGAMNK